MSRSVGFRPSSGGIGTCEAPATEGRKEDILEKLLLTVEETAEVIGIGRTKTFELIAAGIIESVRIGGARRVPTAAVADYVDRLRASAGCQRGSSETSLRV